MKVESVIALGLAAVAQGAPQVVKRAPDGCNPSYDGEFEIAIGKKSAKRSNIEKRCGSDDGALTLTLQDGVLKDSQGRTGYIASNHQFQFDAPVQDGALSSDGWSVCGDGSLALGTEKTFYQCLSGDFYNLYDSNDAAQCEPVGIMVQSCSGGAPPAPPAGGNGGNGGVITTTIVSPLPDGQPQVITTTVPAPVTQIPDGQIQAPTSVPPVSQIPDGQIQVPPSAPPVSQIPDGQIQAPTSTAPAAPPVSQIPDGQIQALTSTAPAAPPVSQIPDGQIQAPTSTAPAAPPVTQIPDGQPQAPTGSPVPSPSNNGTFTPSSSPSAPAPTVAPSSGFKVIPGALTALVAGAVGMFFYL